MVSDMTAGVAVVVVVLSVAILDGGAWSLVGTRLEGDVDVLEKSGVASEEEGQAFCGATDACSGKGRGLAVLSMLRSSRSECLSPSFQSHARLDSMLNHNT